MRRLLPFLMVLAVVLAGSPLASAAWACAGTGTLHARPCCPDPADRIGVPDDASNLPRIAAAACCTIQRGDPAAAPLAVHDDRSAAPAAPDPALPAATVEPPEFTTPARIAASAWPAIGPPPPRPLWLKFRSLLR
ncbi:hypothetical protein L6R50_02600 [Myxococcota bacterium]|nr:hypothetical protein [Myxococcota bacterium]